MHPVPALLTLLAALSPALAAGQTPIAAQPLPALEPGLIAAAHVLPADRVTPGDVLWQAPVGAAFALRDLVARGPVPDPGTPFAAAFTGWLRAPTAGIWALRFAVNRATSPFASCTVRIALEGQDVLSGVIKEFATKLPEGSVPLAEPGEYAVIAWLACVPSGLPRATNAMPVAIEAKQPGSESWSPGPLFRTPAPPAAGLKPGGRTATATPVAWTTLVRDVGGTNALGEELGRIAQPRADSLELGEALALHHGQRIGTVSEALHTVRKGGRWVYAVAVVDRPAGGNWWSNGCETSLKVEDHQILADTPHRVAGPGNDGVAQSYLAAGGADLVPGVYKLTLTAVCSAEQKPLPLLRLLVKSPDDAGLRPPVAGEIAVGDPAH